MRHRLARLVQCLLLLWACGTSRGLVQHNQISTRHIGRQHIVRSTSRSWDMMLGYKAKGLATIPKKRPVLLCPAQLSIPDDYDELIGIFNARGHQVYGADLDRISWLLGLAPSAFTADYLKGTLKPSKTLGFYYDAMDRSLARLKEQHPGEPFHLVGHSIGGWVARGWLSERASAADQALVLSLTTLGTPNRAAPPESPFAAADQTRGLLKFINDNFPSGLMPRVKYTSVVGTGVQARFPPRDVEELLAFISYLPLGGDKDGLGDGIVPWRCGIMVGAVDGDGSDDSESIILPLAKHSGFVPTLGRAVRLKNHPWYGDAGTVKLWAGVLDEAEATAEERDARARRRLKAGVLSHALASST